MYDSNERSAYPHPEDFQVMRPEYTQTSEEPEEWQASIIMAPFKVSGRSISQAGARRAALYEAEKTYRSYHPSYGVRNPYPDRFIDREGTLWRRVPAHQRDQLGDYAFALEGEEEDFADIEQMLMWDVRPAPEDEE